MGKLGSFGSALGSLLSFFVRLSTTIVQYAALILSLGFSTFLIGKYTHRAIHSRKEVVELVYWRDPKKSAAVLAAIFVMLYVFQRYAFHSIVVYAALAALVATVGLRAFKLVEGYYKKTDTGNPFQNYLDLEVSIPQDKLHAQVDLVVDHAMFVFKKLRHIYLVENLLDSIKFGLLLYSLTYVASWFSGLGLIVLFVVAVFALPKTYELYKEPIDQYIQLAKEQIEHFNNIAQEKLPFLKGVVPPSSSVPAAEKKEE